MSDHLIIWSAPDESYTTHVETCFSKWEELSGRLVPSIARLFGQPAEDVSKAVSMMLLCHDIGKLTAPWQKHIGEPKDKRRRRGPPHATLGGAYLLASMRGDLSEACALAILMHHIDSGLTNANLEYPAEAAINSGLTTGGTERIAWAEGGQEAFDVSKRCLPSGADAWATRSLAQLTLIDLDAMAKELRQWARCPRDLQRHARRLQALALHHVLKVCDWRAASERLDSASEGVDEDGDEVNKDDQQPFSSILATYLDGGLLV